MIGEAEAQLAAVGQALARSAPSGWQQLELKVSGAG